MDFLSGLGSFITETIPNTISSAAGGIADWIVGGFRSVDEFFGLGTSFTDIDGPPGSGLTPFGTPTYTNKFGPFETAADYLLGGSSGATTSSFLGDVKDVFGIGGSDIAKAGAKSLLGGAGGQKVQRAPYTKRGFSSPDTGQASKPVTLSQAIKNNPSLAQAAGKLMRGEYKNPEMAQVRELLIRRNIESRRTISGLEQKISVKKAPRIV